MPPPFNTGAPTILNAGQIVIGAAGAPYGQIANLTDMLNLYLPGVQPTVLASAGIGQVTSGLTATGTTSGTAALAPSNYSVFSTVASGSGAILNPAVSGFIVVANFGASFLVVYPPAGAAFNALSAGSGIVVASGTFANILQATPTQYYRG